MKLLTVLVNDRIDHTLNFDALYRYPNSYIAEIKSGNSVNLVKFYAVNNKCDIHADNGKMQYGITDISYTDVVAGTMGKYQVRNVEFIVHLSNNAVRTGGNDGTVQGGVIGNQNFWRNNELMLPITDNCVYNVSIKFAVNGVECSEYATINIGVAPEECIWDVVLDYGSEASQLLVCRRSQNNTVNDLSVLFDEFFMVHNGGKLPVKNEDGNEREHYIQYDSDNERYYKSVFYIKRAFQQGHQIDVSTPLGMPNDDITLLNLYRDQATQQANYMIVPNLKIANHGGVFLPKIQYGYNYTTAPEIGDRSVYRKIVNAFMQIAIKKTNLGGDIPRFLNVVLLVPNTYRQDEVTKVLAHLLGDIPTLAVGDDGAKTTITGVEVSSISESDASFVGVKQCMNINAPLRNAPGKYLIMDAGKGTLDFSVIEDMPNNPSGSRYTSLFRSGIIGAGNAISYAVLLALLDHIFAAVANEAQRKAMITQFVNGHIIAPNADLAEVTSLMKSVERYKRLYNDDKLTNTGVHNTPTMQDLAKLDITALNNLIYNMCQQNNLVRDESAINDMIDNICYAVSDKLRDYYPTNVGYQVNHIIFAGRGFLMNKLRVRMEQVLKGRNNSICGNAQVHNFNQLVTAASTVTPKNICMFIVEALRNGQYNGRLVGKPFIVTNKKSENKDDNENKPKESRFDKLVKKAKVVLNAVQEKALPYNQWNEDSEKGVVAAYQNNLDGYQDVIWEGTDELVVSGMRYAIQLPLHAQAERMSVSIFFDGYDFVVRREGWLGGSKSLLNISPIMALDGNYVYESTFPFLLTPKDGSMPFPKKVTENDGPQQPIVPNPQSVPVPDNDDVYEQQLHDHDQKKNKTKQ